MVIGNADAIPGSLFLPGQTIASKIANTFGEASGPIQYAALAALGLCLYLVSLGLSIAVRMIARRSVVSAREKR
jgi:phosphate transport system permease protein